MMPRANTNDHVAEMKAATARASRPKETADERNARRMAKADEMARKASAMRVRAELDALVVRATRAGVAAKRVAAIRTADTLCQMLNEHGDGAEHLHVDSWLGVLTNIVDDAESVIDGVTP